MSIKITDQDRTALRQLAELCSPLPIDELVNKCSASFAADDIRKKALTIVYHPTYESSVRRVRLLALARDEEASRQSADQVELFEMQESALSELFFKRMWAFQRDSFCTGADGSKPEVYIQYARPQQENEWLDQTFCLAALCTHQDSNKPDENCQYSFWSPNFDVPELHCVTRFQSRCDYDTEWSDWGSSSWMRLRMDGRWLVSESRHPVKGRRLFSQELTSSVEPPSPKGERFLFLCYRVVAPQAVKTVIPAAFRTMALL